MIKKIFVFLFVFSLTICSEKSTYLNVSGKSKIESTMELEKTEKGYICTEKYEGFLSETIYDEFLNLEEFKYKDDKNKTELTMKKDKENIKVTGIYKGKKEERTIKIDKAPWYQNWGIGLKNWILSRESVTFFWSIDPSDVSKVAKFKAEKIGKTKIKIQNKDYDTLKVKTTLDGFFSMFFSIELYFDSDTGQLLYTKFPGGVYTELIESTIN